MFVSDGSTGTTGVVVSTGGEPSTGADTTAGMGSGTGGDCIEEICDGIDNDCDDEVDEGCDCIDGAMEDCFTADPRLEGVGECEAGSRECLDGAWGACLDEVVPVAEECNSLDDDCDGDVDEDFGQVTCGEGICMVTIDVCVDGESQTCVPGEPQTEECNGFDDNCDGQVDEIDCECLNGEMQDCYTGPMGTEGVGICSLGTQLCVDGMWSSCAGDQTPLPEACDGQDNNCDGTPDDGNPGGGNVCATGLPGTCAAGTTACVGGSVVCQQTVFPVPEICDGFDNDCDTGIDEGNPEGGQTCSTGLNGQCDAGITACQSSVLNCLQVVFPAAEQCNSLDDDCDGGVDENNPGSGAACPMPGLLGSCANGGTTCVNGSLECEQVVFPATETCDGVDQDCNGVIDDGAIGGGSSCPTGLPGVCNAGISDCSGGAPICTQVVFSSPEVCDGLDNNCNGAVDDGNPGGGSACNTGQPGVCDAGVTACSGGSVVCNTTTSPTPEVCDGLDNDCDTVVDDGNPGGGANCNTGLSGICAAGTTQCSGGGVVCNQNSTSVAELCNGLDDDCDGAVDDGNPGSGAACNTGFLGLCAAGVTNCSGGAIACNQTVFPAAEVCDGSDNDCDGPSDEGNPGGGLACSTGLQGVCAAGTTACSGGSIVCNQNVAAGVESCDGIDNDCDGVIDDGNPGGGANCATGLLGQCAAGTTSCSGGALACNQNQLPSTEVCDAFDNDCDGVVDDGNPGGGVVCSTGLDGVCSAGTTSCTAGAVVCNQNVMSSAEVCDGLDNDCDASADEGNPGGGAVCSTGLAGVCAAGTTACTAGALVCNQNVASSAEICDGFDNDCDTGIDEGNPQGNQACSTGLQGVCAAGLTQCVGGMLNCNQQAFATAEICDGLDNDCDGSIDEGNPESGQACSTGLPGTCDAGLTTCTAGALECSQVVFPAAETCDGEDEDCDGVVDDGAIGGGMACPTGVPGECATGVSDCSGGMPVCNQTVFPALEVCDGLDNDCDGTIDDGNPGGGSACATGQPGVCAPGTETCSGGVVQCLPDVPSSGETCDGLDNDCDGTVDDGNPGGGLACGTGQPGVCSAGTTACSGGAIVCNQNVMPSAEVCDGLDNDCDGSVNEGNPGGGLFCDTGLNGVCEAGTTACTGGAIVCNQTTTPSAETCDGQDNDCDGFVDENNPGGNVPCASGQPGVCGPGHTVCTGGGLVCTPNVVPGAEVCDGSDNDCDGATDEGNPGGGANCSTGQPGVCAPGTTACTGGAVVCNQNVMSTAEVCDSLDNDCDGSVDEGNPGGGANCSTGLQGLCGAGTTSCNGGSLVCNQTQFPVAETCDGLDNDCDGSTDEGNPGGGVACSTGLQGVCAAGVTSCSGGGVVCQQTVMPSAEVCDGIDNDCDGLVDEGNPGGGANCNTGLTGVCAAGTTSCSGGALVCNQNVGSSAEVCDGFDNDCDGTADEGNPGGGGGCSTGLNGVCGAGTLACTAGALQCNQNVMSSAEVCDGLDNDCDASTDEGNPGGGANCNTGLFGACAPGTTSCTGGSVVCNQNNLPSAEVCDSVDNDCDASTDEGNPGGGAACSTGLLGVCSAGTQTCTGGSIVCSQNQVAGAEVCADGLDNDCDGSTDEGCMVMCTEQVSGGSFEAGTPNPFWTEASSNFGTPLCTVAGCGNGGGSGPFAGSWWAWFGGINGAEVAQMSQDLVIPVGTATLSFYLEIPNCSNNAFDDLTVTIDGITVAYFDNNEPSCDVLGYVQQTFDVSMFADGMMHTLLFDGQFAASGGPPSNLTSFFVDSVSLVVCP